MSIFERARDFIPGGSSITDLVVTIQNLVNAANAVSDSLMAQVPHYTSGSMAASTVVSLGFTRVTGIAVVAPSGGGSADGELHDCLSIAAANASNLIAIVPRATGYTGVQGIFQQGCVFVPATSQRATIFYAKT